MAKKITKKNEEKIKKEKERREKEEKKKNEKKKEEKRKREKERREKERKEKNEIQKKLDKLNKRKKERIELEENNNTIINNILTINIRTPSPSNSNGTPSSSSQRTPSPSNPRTSPPKKPEPESSKSYSNDSSYENSEVSIPKIPKHPERDDTYKSYTPTALPYENVLLNRDFLRDINKQLKEKNFIINNKYSFHDFCLYYKLKTYFKTNKEEKKETYPNILKYLRFIKEYKKIEYENRFLKEYNNKIYCFYKKKPYERTHKKKPSSSSSESNHSIHSPEKIITQKNIRREKIGPESERIQQEVDSAIKKIEDKKRREIEDKKRRKDGKLRRKRKTASKDWIRYIDIKK